jgi:hypothetical protein
MAAVKGIYYGLEEATLLQMKRDTLAALEKLRKGQRFTSTGGAGKSFSKEHMTYTQLNLELAEIRAALQRLDPGTYGKRVRRMHTDFSRANCGE